MLGSKTYNIEQAFRGSKNNFQKRKLIERRRLIQRLPIKKLSLDKVKKTCLQLDQKIGNQLSLKPKTYIQLKYIYEFIK